jgi:hypothetical protein
MYFHERFICKELRFVFYFFAIRNSIAGSYKRTAGITSAYRNIQLVWHDVRMLTVQLLSDTIPTAANVH